MSLWECGASACGDSRGTRVLVAGVDVSPIMQIFKLVLFCYRSSWWTLVRHSAGKCAIGLRDWWSPMIPFVCHASYMVDQNYCLLPYSLDLWPAVYSWKNWENSEKCLWWQCVIRAAEILPFIISYVHFFLLAFNWFVIKGETGNHNFSFMPTFHLLTAFLVAHIQMIYFNLNIVQYLAHTSFQTLPYYQS